jgi:capsule polysaccharide export protein KpsE/RkpR
MSADDLQKQKAELQAKISQTEGMIGNGMSWKDAQFYLEKYKDQLRVLDTQLAKAQLGEDAVADLKAKKAQLETKLQSLDAMKKDGTISDQIYKDKKKDLEKEIQQVERDIVDAM